MINKKSLSTVWILMILSTFFSKAQLAEEFLIADKNKSVEIWFDPQGTELDRILADALANDIALVTGVKPLVKTDLSTIRGHAILIGSTQSATINKHLKVILPEYDRFVNQRESFYLKVIEKPFKNIDKALIIGGSDKRGTAYGVFTLSEWIGISPWQWWADVTPKKQQKLIINRTPFLSSEPSVQYRGIFINDEDWGLQPWAEKTFEPETKDIGPKTYAKVFELLLRLKANLLWPAMHPSTIPFYQIPENRKVADDYGIVIGTSHAEPMMRNNVREWNEKTIGSFNYISNKERVHTYWQERVKETSADEVIYTMGMRGVHDSGMQGVKGPKEAIPLLENIINDQRQLLSKYIKKDPKLIPQVFTAYKEVLDIYDNGLKLPEDITLVWPDDNYGYIQRLANPQEQLRKGGSGVYYHASYWGRPHDYLWLGTQHPALIVSEMMKAYAMKADNLWVLNVGDIKPLEYQIQLFLDMAYHVEPFAKSSYVKKHLLDWCSGIFGENNAKDIRDVLWQSYNLAFERKPEFMGWSQTEPTTQTNYSEYNHFYYNDEASKRIEEYQAISQKAIEIQKKIRKEEQAAYYQLVTYPVVGASEMNKKFLYRDKAYWYAQQQRLSAAEYAQKSLNAYKRIQEETKYFNEKLSDGKWRGMMSMIPRNLPVFQAPVLPDTQPKDVKASWGISPEGMVKPDSSLLTGTNPQNELPTFNLLEDEKYFVDVFLKGQSTLQYDVKSSDDWIVLSNTSGKLEDEDGARENRIWVSILKDKAIRSNAQKGYIEITGKGISKRLAININRNNSNTQEPRQFAEVNGYISMYATHYSDKKDGETESWQIYDGLGHAGNSLIASALSLESQQLEFKKETAAWVDYDFYNETEVEPLIHVYTLPTHPSTNEYSMRYAVSIDDGDLQIVDFKTFGRSNEWKLNVLSNQAVRTLKGPRLSKGKHTLRIYKIDPNVMLDRILIDFGGLKKAYRLIPETIK
jgi:hypothetical protein